MLKMLHTTSENENNYLSTQGQLNKETLSERYDGKKHDDEHLFFLFSLLFCAFTLILLWHLIPIVSGFFHAAFLHAIIKRGVISISFCPCHM